MSLIAPDFLSVDYDRMRGEDVPNPEGWVFHWPASRHVFAGTLAESQKYLRSWEAYHLSKRWRGIAYDYAIDMAGRKFRLRGTGRSAATSGDYDEDGVPNNTETDAILCVIGMGQKPSTQMVEAAHELIAELGGRRDYIIGHRDAKGIVTDCPGPYIMRDIVDVLNEEDELTPEQEKALAFAEKLRAVVEDEMGSNHRFAKYTIEHQRSLNDEGVPEHTHDEYAPKQHPHTVTVKGEVT